MSKPRQLNARMRLVLDLRDQGKTFREIGDAIGTSVGRAAEIYQRATWLRRYHAQGIAGDPLYGLSALAANCLHNAGLQDREAILAAVKAGKLRPPNRIRNCGWAVFNEVCAWLGVLDPHATARCPHCGQKMKRGAR